MSYSIPITQIYLAKTHGKVNVTDEPLLQRHCMGNCSHINSIQVSFAAGSQETHHWPLLLRKNTMVSQFRIFKEMENKWHEKFFFISPVFLPKTLIRWGLNPGRTGVRIICVSLVDRTIFQCLCLIRPAVVVLRNTTTYQALWVREKRYINWIYYYYYYYNTTASPSLSHFTSSS